MIYKNKDQLGFTIVELLIVIVIIGILAAITLVAYGGIQDRARASAASSALNLANKKLAAYAVDNPGYPATLATVEINDTTNVTYQYSYDNGATPATYCVTATSGTISYKASAAAQSPTVGACPGHGAGGAAAITNLVPNPSFETNLTGWSWANGSGYTAAVSSGQTYSGTSSLAISAPTTVADKYFEKQSLASVSAGAYTLSMYVYLTNSGTTFSSRYIWFGCNSGTCTPVQNVAYDQTKLNQWQRVTITLSASTAASLWVRLYAPTGGTSYFDGIMVTSGSTAYNYADGNSTNWVWNGTAHNSTSTGSPQ